MDIAKRVRVRGRVQGVFFRESMRREAQTLGLRGWVRNRADGSVEAMVQGEASSVAALILWAGRGPPDARVDSLEENEEAPDPQLTGFERRPTE